MNLIDELLAKANPQQEQRVRDRMMLAAQIADALDAKGWNQKELAVKLGKQPSEISKWLSGTHNFTIDTLSDLGRVLEVKLLCTKDEVPSVITKVVTRYQDVFIPASLTNRDIEPVPFARFQSSIVQQPTRSANA